MRVRVRHRRIYLDASGAHTDTLIVEDGRVVATHDDGQAVDVELLPQGTCVFPGLIEAHIHLWGLGLRAGTVDLRGAPDTHTVYERLAAAGTTGGWVLAKNWDQNTWSDARSLSLARLDAMFPDTPVCLRRVDGHAYWVNSAALAAAGIDAAWEAPPGGEFRRDAQGRPTGALVDEAMRAMDAVLPLEGEDDDRATFLESAAMLHGFGITSAHKAWMPYDRLAMLEALRDAAQLPLRLHLLFDCNDAHLDALLARGPWADRWISARGIKFFADGALGSRGAAVLSPYRDGGVGLVVETRETMNARIPELAAAGWQVAVHAIGDRGARNVLDAFARVSPDDRARTRPRLEHAQMVHDADLTRFGELGVIASIQPIHMHSDAAWAHEALDESQMAELFRWRDLARVTRLCGGSDFPIEDPNPWHAIAVSSTRQHLGGAVFREDQRLTRHEALRLYTEDAAWAGFSEGHTGALRPGFEADFCVLDTDPFEASDDAVWNTQALATYLGGQCVWERSEQ